MDVLAAAKSFNENAIRQDWHQFCDPTLAFTEPCYEKFFAVWRAKAGGNSMPSRSQMTARDLKDFLRDIMIVQREEENGALHYRWRLLGTNITKIIGHQTGKLFEETCPYRHVTRWMTCCNMVLESEQPWRFLGRVQLEERNYLKAEHLYVPLADDDGVPSFVMGYLRYQSRHQDDEKQPISEVVFSSGGMR